MSENPFNNLEPLAIEGNLPLKAVGIENLKEANPKHMPPHRYLHPWFARRPTPASRLAILASVLPSETSSDELLRLLQIGPKEGIDEDLETYVEQKKATESERSGTLEEHYGYPRPFTQSPSQTDLTKLHKSLEQHWDGRLPTVLDPTAGGGVIPFESLRYGLPTKANELNPVPSIILKVLLEYAPAVGSISGEVEEWGEKVRKRARENLEGFYPSTNAGQVPDSYVSTYSISCPTCGCEIPLVPKWWIRNRKSAQDVVVRPKIRGNEVEYQCLVDPSDEDLADFDPSEGPVSRGGDVECLSCGVVTESEDVQPKLNQGEFEYTIYCVKYRDSDGSYGYRSPMEEDHEAVEKAERRVNSDFEISKFLSEPIPNGRKTKEPKRYGMKEWRDLYSPRQLVGHFEYYKALDHYKEDIYSEYDEETAEAIIVLLTLAANKMAEYNSRLASWHMGKGYPDHVFKGKNFAFKRVFVDNNMSVGGMGHESHLSKIVDSYEEIASYLPDGSPTGEVANQDAASLPYDTDEIQAVIVDPPYYSSIMYAELSDFFYVLMKEYLGEAFPSLFDTPLTNKEDEAVANPNRFDDLASSETSKKELANQDYEEKMSDIFSELYRVLEPGGVMTVMFTHKETDAWDTLTMSLINSGFVITSTHPITSEMPQRAGMQNSASADSTLLLTGRKPHEERDPENAVPTLWSDVEADTREAAKEAARDLLESGISLTKTDVIISAFGPTLRVFADAYPVVDDEDEEVPPRKALETAREAVTQILVDEYLEGMDVDNLDDVTEWYILCWLVHESETFAYDDGRQLGLGIGVDIDEIKRSTKTWRKRRGDISLRGHGGRVQNINEKPEDRSSRLPVDPGDLSFPRALDAVHAAMHVYEKKGEAATVEWLRERNFDTDAQFKETLRALLQVLPHNHEDWELARDLAVGRTSDVLDLDFSPNVFAESGDETKQSGLEDY